MSCAGCLKLKYEENEEKKIDIVAVSVGGTERRRSTFIHHTDFRVGVMEVLLANNDAKGKGANKDEEKRFKRAAQVQQGFTCIASMTQVIAL